MSDHMFNDPTGHRGGQEIKGIRMAQLYSEFRAAIDYHDPSVHDPDAFTQNFCCEIEKLMGIYPNVPNLRTRDED